MPYDSDDSYGQYLIFDIVLRPIFDIVLGPIVDIWYCAQAIERLGIELKADQVCINQIYHT